MPSVPSLRLPILMVCLPLSPLGMCRFLVHCLTSPLVVQQKTGSTTVACSRCWRALRQSDRAPRSPLREASVVSLLVRCMCVCVERGQVCGLEIEKRCL